MPMPHLTPRERDIVILICDDLTVQQIALKLGVTDKTIYYHQPRICAKLGVNGPAGVLRWAIEAGMVKVPRPQCEMLFPAARERFDKRAGTRGENLLCD